MAIATSTIIATGISAGIGAYQSRKAKKAQNAANARAKKEAKQAKKAQFLEARRARREAKKFQADFGITTEPLNITTMFRNAIAPRRIVYGRARVGGILFYAEATGAGNAVLYMIVGFSEGPCEKIEKLYADADEVTLDATGAGTRIVWRTHLGHLRDTQERTFTVDIGTDEITLSADDYVPQLAAGQMVTVRSTGTLPTGLQAGTPYLIRQKINPTVYTLSAILNNDLLNPGALFNFTDTGMGTLYIRRREQNIPACFRTQNWKVDQHKLIGICYGVAALTAGEPWSGVPNLSAVVRGRSDILDPRRKFAITYEVPLFTFTLANHGLKDNQLVVPYGTVDPATGLLEGGLVRGKKYYVIVTSSTRFKLADYPGGDPVTTFSTAATGSFFIPGFYDNNAALCLAHVLASPINRNTAPVIDYFDDIDQATLEEAADICDETIETLASQSASHTFNPADVNTSTNLITIAGHGLADNDAFRLSSSTSDLPDGLSPNTDYYADYIDVNTIGVRGAANARVLINITDQGTGVHSMFRYDKRYTMDGPIDVSQSREDIIGQFKIALGLGDLIYTGGKFYIYPGKYEAPTFEITEDMIIGSSSYQSVSSRLERINEVGGVYMSEQNEWIPFDFPVVENAAYKLEDGELLREDIDLPFTKSPAAAQRIAKLVMETSRMMKRVSLVCNFRAFPALVSKTVMLTISRYGFSQKVFKVESFRLQGEAGGDLDVLLDLVEWEPGVYDWDYLVDEQDINEPASIINPGKKVADITASPTEGTGHTFPLDVTLSTATTNAAIRYTVDGATPTTIGSGTEYTGPITLASPGGQTIRARGFLTGFVDSDAYVGTFDP